MFIIDLEYQRPMEAVEQWLEEHKAFLKQQYANGVFLMSGRKQPRTGGVILAQADTRAHLEALIQQDPFYREGVARFTITEFLPTMTADALSSFAVQP